MDMLTMGRRRYRVAMVTTTQANFTSKQVELPLTRVDAADARASVETKPAVDF